jgi:mannose-6-phosphate isomerase class I
MKIEKFPFQTLKWNRVTKEKGNGETGHVFSQTVFIGDIRVRKIEYSAGYKANHWCNKGHILLCMEGEMETELQDGRIMKLQKGESYFVGDDSEPHRTATINGCKLFIVD